MGGRIKGGRGLRKWTPVGRVAAAVIKPNDDLQPARVTFIRGYFVLSRESITLQIQQKRRCSFGGHRLWKLPTPQSRLRGDRIESMFFSSSVHFSRLLYVFLLLPPNGCVMLTPRGWAGYKKSHHTSLWYDRLSSHCELLCITSYLCGDCAQRIGKKEYQWSKLLSVKSLRVNINCVLLQGKSSNMPSSSL